MWARTIATTLLIVAPWPSIFVQTSVAAESPGVVLRVYEIEPFVSSLPELARGQAPNIAEVRGVIDFPGKGGDFGGPKDMFVTEVSGSIKIRTAGVYTFRLMSDDGARLWIDDKLVIDNDGLHGPAPKDGKITLSAGMHKLLLRHFEMSGGEQLTLQWKTPSGEFELVPTDVLSHDASADLSTAPGKKRIIPPLRRGLPGDGSPVVGMNPGFKVGDGGVLEHETTVEPERVAIVGSSGGVPPEASLWLPAFIEQGRELDLYEFDNSHFAEQQLARVADCVVRICSDKNAGMRQGCVFRFATGEAGQLEDLEAGDTPAFEMKAVRLLSNGLEVEFTAPLDERVGWDTDSYYIEQWPIHPELGPVRDGTATPVKSASVSPDHKNVFLEVPGLKAGCVIYLRLLPPCLSASGDKPWSTEAWYTALRMPTEEHAGKVLPRPERPAQNVLTDAEKADGWRLLFDGKTTDGWRGFRKKEMPSGWQVVDGCLVRVAGGGDIVTDEQFDNFELQLEWRICAAGNSGIFYRVSEDEDAVWRTGAEMQVLDNSEHADGRNALTSAGANYAMYAPVRDVTQPVGLFNKARIVARGPHVEHWLNGVKVVEYDIGGPDWETRFRASKFKSLPKYSRLPSGHIALQDHGDRVWYRNIAIRELK